MSRKTIGILVRDDKYFDYLKSFCSAAFDKDYKVQVFFSGKGVLLTQYSDFGTLINWVTPYVCEVSYRSHNLGGKELPGVGFKQFVTQARNAEMLDECDRYLVF